MTVNGGWGELPQVWRTQRLSLLSSGREPFSQHVFNIMELPFFYNQNVDFPLRIEEKTRCKKGVIGRKWGR